MEQCEIVQDLLPLYADELAGRASTEMIQRHIEHCEACRRQLEYMKHPIARVDIMENQTLKRDLQRQKKKRRIRLLLTAAVTLVLGILFTYVFLWYRGHFNIISRKAAPDKSADCTVYNCDIYNRSSEQKGVLAEFRSRTGRDGNLKIFSEDCSFGSLEWSPDSRLCLFSVTNAMGRTKLLLVNQTGASHTTLDISLDAAVAQSPDFDFLRNGKGKAPNMDDINMHYQFLDWADENNLILSYQYRDHRGFILFDTKSNSILGTWHMKSERLQSN